MRTTRGPRGSGRRTGRRATLLRAALVTVLGATMATACAPGSPGDSGPGSDPEPRPNEPVYPGDEWGRMDPVDAGFDPDILADIAAEAEANGSNCLVVTRHGRIVADWYWNGTDATSAQEVYSTTKSVTSTLVGIAQADGSLAIDDEAATYIGEWANGESQAVTVEDLVSNDSGRHWDLATDYVGLTTAPDRTAFAVGLGQDVPPGHTWAYNNAAIQTLDRVLESATGQDPAAFAEARLFEPLGMQHTDMTHDAAGNTATYFGMQSTCEDLARFGYLFGHGGRWEDDQVVPADWVDAATGRPSQDINAAYGYLWWLNRRGPITGPLDPMTRDEADVAPDRQQVESAPVDMYWARGLGGQVVQIDPGTDTVVVRLGPGDANATYNQANTARVVTEALVNP